VALAHAVRSGFPRSDAPENGLSRRSRAHTRAAVVPRVRIPGKIHQARHAGGDLAAVRGVAVGDVEIALGFGYPLIRYVVEIVHSGQ